MVVQLMVAFIGGMDAVIDVNRRATVDVGANYLSFVQSSLPRSHVALSSQLTALTTL